MLLSTSVDSYQSQALQIAGIAAGIRKEIFGCEKEDNARPLLKKRVYLSISYNITTV